MRKLTLVLSLLLFAVAGESYRELTSNDKEPCKDNCAYCSEDSKICFRCRYGFFLTPDGLCSSNFQESVAYLSKLRGVGNLSGNRFGTQANRDQPLIYEHPSRSYNKNQKSHNSIYDLKKYGNTDQIYRTRYNNYGYGQLYNGFNYYDGQIDNRNYGNFNQQYNSRTGNTRYGYRNPEYGRQAYRNSSQGYGIKKYTPGNLEDHYPNYNQENTYESEYNPYGYGKYNYGKQEYSKESDGQQYYHRHTCNGSDNNDGRKHYDEGKRYHKLRHEYNSNLNDKKNKYDSGKQEYKIDIKPFENDYNTRNDYINDNEYKHDSYNKQDNQDQDYRYNKKDDNFNKDYYDNHNQGRDAKTYNKDYYNSYMYKNNEHDKKENRDRDYKSSNNEGYYNKQYDSDQGYGYNTEDYISDRRYYGDQEYGFKNNGDYYSNQYFRDQPYRNEDEDKINQHGRYQRYRYGDRRYEEPHRNPRHSHGVKMSEEQITQEDIVKYGRLWDEMLENLMNGDESTYDQVMTDLMSGDQSSWNNLIEYLAIEDDIGSS